MQRKTYFTWMGSYWSIAPEQWEKLVDLCDQRKPFDLEQMGAKELKCRPHRPCYRLSDADYFLRQ
jgi:hypothetical protein